MKQTKHVVKQLAVFCPLYLAVHSAVWADSYAEFDGLFLRGDTEALGIDVRRFSYKNSFVAGKYELDLYVNNEKKGVVEAQFINDPTGKPVVHLCLTPKIQALLDLQPEAYRPTDAIAENCISAEQAIADGQFEFDVANLKIKLTIAQALTVRRPRGYVSPHLWQDGVPAFYLNYHLNHFNSHLQNNKKTTQTHLGIRAGLSVAGWSLVHNGAKSWQNTNAYTDFSGKYQSLETSLHRSIPTWKSKISLGDISTSGDLLDGVSLRGVRLTSDDSVLPSSQRGYAPIIQGIAHSNASVSVRQNGYLIYQINVPAGPFIIDDLNPTGYGGEITVEILESNGEKREFKVPFATLVQLVRPKHFKYQLAYGRYRSGQKVYADDVLQGTLQYGVSNNLSLNTGFAKAPNYHAYLIGAGFNTPIGAFVADTTWSKAYFINSQQTRNGYSVRASYNVKLPTDTHITLATYRYSSREFYRLPDTLAANNTALLDDRILQNNLSYRPKSQYQVSINQPLGKKRGVLYLSGSTQNYWSQKGYNHQYQMSYANSIGKVSYNLGVSQTKNIDNKKDNSFYVSLSMPLGGGHSTGVSYAQYGNHPQMRADLNGQIRNNMHYGINVHKSENLDYALSGNLSYQPAYFNLSANASYDSLNNRQYSANLSGAVVVHPKGVTLSQNVGDTFAIVHAKGAKGAKINGLKHSTLDRFGNGIVPYLTPYNRNQIMIDPDDIPLNLEFHSTATEVIPKANHAMMVEFDTSINPMVLFEIAHPDGVTIPMGSEAFDEKGQLVGYVVQGGQLFASRLDKATGRITLRWSSDQDGQCQFSYHVPDLQNNEQLRSFNVVCEKVKDKAE